jgi:hypothetical protein
MPAPGRLISASAWEPAVAPGTSRARATQTDEVPCSRPCSDRPTLPRHRRPAWRAGRRRRKRASTEEHQGCRDLRRCAGASIPMVAPYIGWHPALLGDPAHAAVCIPAGIEPATPSLPSMRGWFPTPRSTLRPHTFTEVRGAAGEGVVGMVRPRVAQFLANFWHGELIGQLLRSESLARSRWMSRCAEDGYPRDPGRHRRTYDSSPLPRAASTVLAELGGHRLCGWAVTSQPHRGSRRRRNRRRRRGSRQPPRTAALPCQTPLWRRAARAACTLRAAAASRSRSSMCSSAIMAR